MSFFDRLRGFFGARGRNGAPEVSCEDALRLIHDFLDGELEDVPPAVVQAHFDACQRCYPHLRLERSFRRAVRRAAKGDEAPAGLRARVAQLVSEADSEG